ncbi:hypothetical protein GCM10010404_80970 [Nonomuraea africana]|uniref:Polyketide cyclase / dehydrase and lipid transport n=1 Tax=Nonomuraea africana TaxID=46171 RepID=A0ABR9KWX5_9ACTN|nr:hypothetical protein [Nonomuraea africana]MBE1566525.1 hypothetical protein [Nonomuraea africana]
MSISTRTDIAEYTVTVTVRDVAALTDYASKTFVPDQVEVRWMRRQEEQWRRWITVSGPLLRKDGSTGVRRTERCHTPTTREEWWLPAEYQELADSTRPDHFPLPA